MALREATGFSRSVTRWFKSSICCQCSQSRRYASSAEAFAVDPTDDVSPSSSLVADPLSNERLSAFNPAERSRLRPKQLPRSRYVRYFRCLICIPGISFRQTLIHRPKKRLTNQPLLLDTNTALRNITAVLFILINHRQTLTLPLASTFQALSLPHASNKHTTTPLLQIS